MTAKDILDFRLVGGGVKGWEGYSRMWAGRIVRAELRKGKIEIEVDRVAIASVGETETWQPSKDLSPQVYYFESDSPLEFARDGGYSLGIPYVGEYIVYPRRSLVAQLRRMTRRVTRAYDSAKNKFLQA